MTLSSAELDRIARLHEGDLAETPFAVLLYALARARRSAAIEIRRGPLPVADSKLPAAHRSLLEALRERPLRIDQLAAACKISYQDLTRDLYALSLIELVVPSERLPEQPPAKPEIAAAAAAAAPVQDALRGELMELALNHRRKDPFELLGVDPSAAGTTAHRRFLAFAERFAPCTGSGSSTPAKSCATPGASTRPRSFSSGRSGR